MKTLVAVPVFNEEKYVRPVLAQIKRYAPDVLVVDDGSTDGTPAVLDTLAAQKSISLLKHPENRGYGQSLIDAFKFADCRGYDWVITMDCDEQHEPARIPAFIEACRDNNHFGGADIISGSRYMQTDSDADQPPADRRSINRVITEILNSTLNLHLTDSFCGFKAHRVSAMRKLHLDIPGYAFPMQFWVQAVAANLRITEIPVRLIYKDATRHFGGNLDDPTVRLQHYLEVLCNEVGRVRRQLEVGLRVLSCCGARAEC
jgi:glycosyltransferase involved in cell wall biosynthesis